MSQKHILILVGVLVLLLGCAQIASSPRGAPNRGLQPSNIGINTGITGPHRSTLSARATGKNAPLPIGPDWIGLATVVVGLSTALVGMFRA
jgi:hypothetical protein